MAYGGFDPRNPAAAKQVLIALVEYVLLTASAQPLSGIA